MILSADRIRLAAAPADKDSAIREAAQLLVKSGAIDAAYADSMLRREQEADTFLGNGIAIPHGQRGDRGLIRQTGIAVLQVPQGVRWNGEDVAHLVVAIAAQGDEHIAVLRRLTDVLGESDLAARLAQTGDKAEILRALDPDAPAGGEAPAVAAAAAPPGGGLTAEVQAPAAAGMHARPARVLVQAAKGFQSRITLHHGGRSADARSMIALLQLGAGPGAAITLEVSGPDEAAALAALRQAFAEQLGDDDAAASGPADTAPATVAADEPLEPGAIAGLPASPGIAIGVLHRFRSEAAGYAATASDPLGEKAALEAALEAARAELKTMASEMAQRVGDKHAAIFAAHEEFLEDPELLAEARAAIDSGASAPAGWMRAAEARAGALAGMGDPLLAARATDMKDVARRVLRQLVGGGEAATAPLPQDAIILAEDLTPSETANLDPARVVGLATAAGGPTAHTAILARALGIPAIVAAGPGVLALADGTRAVLDGERGRLIPDPDEAVLERARAAKEQGAARAEAARQAAFRPAITRDGHRVEVAANVRRPEEAIEAVAAGAEGSGLVRSEFLFDERAEPPTEEEQFDLYRRLAEGFGGLPVVLRTLDAGGDKPLRFVRHPVEANPFLGLRGLRLSLAEPALFRAQIRAALRAARHGDLRIMLPMVDGLADLRAAREIIEAERAALATPPVEVGIMVEVPSAAVMADQLAREADFFSIGTNDLTQYALAVDRLHPTLGARSDALDPAVLRLIDMTVKAAHARGRWVGVCGNMAADPMAAPILLGLGVDELSVSIPNVAALKAQIRALSMAEAEAAARLALNCATAAEVRALPSLRKLGHAG
ncbi:phosphoenolpyruvate--protein phosphotransferase [Pseudoroseomonas cervicalis]|uniref:phosphoenolpyruvate--protein phosphotransferase n=1 Tax=Teichococcus cervicalis TaxID=204525 RepID=UPI0027864B2A|nr:phosphoenolpyruvate--protein phosphotransferase [Pseudoroseomonas cervicalis]MDQ1079123.1 phosphoenolpyruvate-protein phosphotransferase [Pseudoroseomonas cervicalis]